MRNKKLLFILIPVIVVAVVLIAGIVFLALNGSPEKIFKQSISKVFDVFDNSEDFSTMKGKMNITANIESDDEDVQSLNTMLDSSVVELNMETDTTNMIVNETLNIKYDNESLLNASVLLQDEKGYVYLPDWLNKYLEIPEEYIEISELTEYYKKSDTLDKNALMDAIKEELIIAISEQELIQEKENLFLNGQETKVTASTLKLKDAQITAFYKELFNNLNKNEKFLNALGIFKEDVQDIINEMLIDIEEIEDVEFIFTIYTKGFLNQFVGVSAKALDSYGEATVGLSLLKHTDGKYEFVAYNEYDGEREEALKVIVENKKESKNKGTATITITVDEEELVLLYKYETQKDKTTFTLSTEIEGVTFAISGNAVENGNNIKGNFVISLQEETMGTINLNCAYDFTYGVHVQKVDTRNAVLIDELSEEDQTTLMTNLQNSTLFQNIENFGFVFGQGMEEYYTDYNEPQVSYDGYTVKYTIPEGFEVSEYSSKDLKMYNDEHYNSIHVSIDLESSEDYMSYLDDSYVLTSEYYENQQISDTMTYTVNGKDFKYRTITYNDEYAKYVELYFAYELDDEHCYVVEVDADRSKMSMDIIEKFLNIVIE